VLFWVSSYMSLWSNILFNCAVLINLIVAFFYPFEDTLPSKYTGFGVDGRGTVLDFSCRNQFQHFGIDLGCDVGIDRYRCHLT
jgi:hypothetical protein